MTTRRRTESLTERGGRDSHGGMGLGFFIAKTLLERSGARVSLANKRHPEHWGDHPARLAARLARAA